jgi:hypothetical protein
MTKEKMDKEKLIPNKPGIAHALCLTMMMMMMKR